MHGVGFAIQNKLLSSVEKPVPISSRLSSLRLHTNCGPVTIIATYAPTLTSDLDVKESFYNQLSAIVQKTPSTERLMILGDFNARVGANSSAWPDILGNHGYGNMNDNGQRLLELCSTHKLCVPSSFFQGSSSSKVTWRHPRSKRWHQLDHVLVKREHLKEVTHCRSLHSADCDTDHALLRCKLRMVPSKFHYARPKPTPHLDVSTTHAPALQHAFQELLASSFVLSPPHVDISAAWQHFHSVTTKAAFSIFGKRSRSQPDWFKTHASLLLPAIDSKRSARLSYLQHNTRSNKAALKQACCNVQRVTRIAMQAYWSTLCDRIESSASIGNIRGVFEGLKEALGPVPKKSSPLCSLSGELLTDLESQLARWAEHYSLLYAQPVTADTLAITAAVPELSPMSNLDADITIEEVKSAIKALKNNKSPGADGLPLRLIRQVVMFLPLSYIIWL